MLERADLQPVFFAPFVSSVMRVESTWVDYNGHLNMAYYNVLFDRAVDEAFYLVGLGESYLKRSQCSYFSAEVHVRYLRELTVDDPVRSTLQLIDYDDKRLHFFQQLYHATQGWISATSEQMALHIDMRKKKVAPFAADILSALAAMQAAHGLLPKPEAAGRRIAMPVRPPLSAPAMPS